MQIILNINDYKDEPLDKDKAVCLSTNEQFRLDALRRIHDELHAAVSTALGLSRLRSEMIVKDQDAPIH